MADMNGDGIDDALEGAIRVAVTGAGRAAELVVRAREQQLRDAQARSEQEASELTARLAAERNAARASLTTVYRSEWWDEAQPEDIARAYQTAHAWTDVDPEAARAEQRIAQELRDRYGVDLPVEAGGDPAAVREALDRADAARDASATDQASAQRDRVDGAALMAEADVIDAAANELDQRAAGASERGSADAGALTQLAGDLRRDADRVDGHAELAYDSVERRESMAALMEDKADAATVDARVTADVAQAQPATEATRNAPGRAPKARRNRATVGRQAQRSFSR